MGTDNENRIKELEQQLLEAKREVNSLKLAVRAETLKVKISSEYSSFALWDRAMAIPSFIFMPREKSLKGLFAGNESFWSKRAYCSPFQRRKVCFRSDGLLPTSL